MKSIYMHMVMFAPTRNRIVNGPKAVNYSTKAQAMVRTLCSASLREAASSVFKQQW